jgi:16S rRNA (guanine527-N7)-methyltransferase
VLDLCPGYTQNETTEATILKWLATLEQWNHKIDLTAARTEEEFLDLFLADAVVLHRARLDLGDSDHWLDVGAGAGAPGLALALLDPLLRVDLVEPNTKRVAFLRHSIGSLGLKRVIVHPKRLENLSHLAAEDVVSRATLSPDEWFAAGMRLTRRRLWFLLGREPWSVDPKFPVAYDRSYKWPLTGATRRVLALSLATTEPGESPIT